MKFQTFSSQYKTEQVNIETGCEGGSPLTITFINVADGEWGAKSLPHTIQCFAEKKKQSSDSVYYSTGGMSSYGNPYGQLSFQDTGKGTGFVLPKGADIVGTTEANYKHYKDSNGNNTMGVRSTDFHRILTKGGKQFWIIVLHLPVGNLADPLYKLKRYRILKSLFAQAHHIKEETKKPVFIVGDLNMTRSDLSVFKETEEGKQSARGKILIPKSTGFTTIGEFKTCFRFDGSDQVDLNTNLDMQTHTPYDIDHIFVPSNQPIDHFCINRSIIGYEGMDGQILDHAMISMRVRL